MAEAVGPGESVLTQEDAAEVSEELIPARNNTYDLGAALNLPEGVLAAVHAEEDETTVLLRRVVYEALNRAAGLTWRDVIDALRSPRVGLSTLANSIEASRVAVPDSSAEGPSDMADLAANPTAEETLGPDDLTDIVDDLLPISHRSFELGVLLKIPLDTVDAIHTQHLNPQDRLNRVVATFLDQVDPIPTWRVIVEAMKSPIVNEPRHARRVEAIHLYHDVVPSGSRLMAIAGPSGTTVTSTTEPMQMDPPPPVTALRDATAVVTEVSQVKAMIAELHHRFDELKAAIREKLSQRKISITSIAHALTSLSPDDDDYHRVFLESRISVLFRAADHDELFGLMNFHWNYLNPTLLDYLARDFEISEVRERVEGYNSDLGRFRSKTSLTLFCRAQKRKRVRLSTEFREAVAMADWPNEVMLEDVEQFRGEYVHHYGLHECAMMLDQIRNL